MKVVIPFCLRLIRSLIIGGVIFCVLFQIVNVPNILIYRGFLLALAAFFALITVDYLFSSERFLTESILGRAVASFSLNICVLVLLPVTFERSVSVFLLREFELAQPEGLTPDELKTKFREGFIHDLSAVERRIDEQKQSGNITLSNGKYVLTNRGKGFLSFARTILPLFSSDDNLLNHETHQ